jgi:clan AA aspartic protease (TIGR02281 family)
MPNRRPRLLHAGGLLAACTAASLAVAVDTVDAKARLKELGLGVSGPKVSLAAADGRDYAFGPSQSLQSALKKLKSLEDAIFSDTIQLERDGGVLVASTVINGQHVQPMMVDSGCSSLLVPHRLAERFNVLPADYDRKVICTLADGSTVQGSLKKLESVRVGRFVVENVECVVLGPEAVAAVPLLGMSFLGKFEFKLNPDAATLEMLKVGAPD